MAANAGRGSHACLPGLARWLLLALALAPAAAQGQGAQLVPLAMSGASPPGGNGTFQLFGIPTINASGQVAFGVSLADTQPPDPEARGVYLADGQTLAELVRVGDPAPDGNGTFLFFSSHGEERFALNADGTVAFRGELEGTAASLPNFDDSGLFLADATHGVTQLVRLGDPAPDGNGVFGPQDPGSIDPSLLPPGLDDAGGASFFGVLSQTTGGEEVDDRGVFHADAGALTRLARIGSQVPGTSETFDRIQSQIASNAAGDVALIGELAFDFPMEPPGPGEPPPFPMDLQRIYVDDGVDFDELFRTGAAPPDGDGVITTIDTVILAETGEVVFRGFVNDTISFLDSGPRLFLTDGTTLEEIARQGELGPGEPEFKFTRFVAVDANGQGQVAVSAVLERQVAPPDNRTSAIYLYEGDVLSLLVREGDPAPDGNGALGDLAGPVFLNENGAVAFFAGVEGTASPNDGGIFVARPGAPLERIVRQGQPLEGSTVNFISFLGSFVFDTDDLSLAGMTAFNDAGQVAFVASLADTRSGVFVNVPEPSAALLAVSALLALGALARRRTATR